MDSRLILAAIHRHRKVRDEAMLQARRTRENLASADYNDLVIVARAAHQWVKYGLRKLRQLQAPLKF